MSSAGVLPKQKASLRAPTWVLVRPIVPPSSDLSTPHTTNPLILDSLEGVSMGILSSAINPIRGMMGEFYNSTAARRAIGVAKRMAYKPYVGAAGAAIGGAEGAISAGPDRRMRGALIG